MSALKAARHMRGHGDEEVKGAGPHDPGCSRLASVSASTPAVNSAVNFAVNFAELFAELSAERLATGPVARTGLLWAGQGLG